ncbi:Protein of unknown function [Pyronema omphalodes CBS 100304]|uniref:Uncharacterized protein n=1 Tax=Pyronema omphalodes (strain CBS 100304) TaxID=1076935 RepID=U4L011_PYROM|nr:Protein of unknown function [Pyronema omphalodes CBS 100304]
MNVHIANSYAYGVPDTLQPPCRLESMTK